MKFQTVLAVFCTLLSFHAHAISAIADAEVEQLIASVASSGCTFIRNGEEHDAPAAAKHLRKKYDYLKDDIESAEAFIEQAASHSSVSNKPYAIRCPQQAEIASGLWFSGKLRALRAARKQTKD